MNFRQKHFLLGVALTLAQAAHASTIYNIDFTTTAGDTPPSSGSFTYDSSLEQFTNFIVVWAGIPFDFTQIANQGPVMNCPVTSAALSFALLTGQSPFGQPRFSAGSDATTTNATFQFAADTGCPSLTSAYLPVNLPAGTQDLSASGTFTATAQVPEPSEGVLTAIGLAGLTLLWRLNRSRKFQ